MLSARPLVQNDVLRRRKQDSRKLHQKMQRIKQNKFNRRIYQPMIKQVFYYDIFIFIFVFFITLLANFTERSIQFNIVISAAFLSKCLIGLRFRNIASFSEMRQYFIIRLTVDTVLILPIIVYYKLRSATYTYNYIIVIITLVVSELIIILKNSKNLYQKSIVENIEYL
jgi:magnesium-transporting ATPase (P-type)